MPQSITITYFTIIICNIALATLVFYKNSKSFLNIIFALFTLSISAWILTLYFLYTLPTNYLLIAGRFNFVFAELIAFFALWLAYYFPIKTFTINTLIKYLLIILTFILVIITLFTDLIDKEEIHNSTDELTTIYGDYYIVFAIYFISLVIISTFTTIFKYKKLNEIHKLHVKYYVAGSLISIYFGILSNIILPTFIGDNNLSKIGPIFSIIFIISISYSILKYKLMDITSTGITFLLLFLGIISFINFANSQTNVAFMMHGFELVAFIIISIYVLKNLNREIHRRKIIETFAKDLEESNARLRKLDEAKSEFISITSHQLRTPLTATKGYISLILEDAYGKTPTKIKEALKKVYTSNERLMELVEDLLNVSRIESGNMKYNFKETSLNDIVNSLYDTFVLRANKKHLEFTIETTKNDVIVYVDPLKIKEVISNLIDNAIKYTTKGYVRVTLDLNLNDNTVSVIVKDSGIGLTKKVLSKLFNKFSRGKDAINLHSEGTGLGLFVGKKITESHDGKIKAVSKGRNEGSKFTLELPIVRILKN